MSNYKVKVNNEAESREVQELFFELGGQWATCGRTYNNMVNVGDYVFFNCSKYLQYGLGINKEEITIPQLRDLVVLKRNDKNDRNVIDPKDDADLYLDSNNNLFVFYLPTQTWKESKLNGEEETMKRLKPITRPLKEYLVPQDNGKYTLTKAPEKRVSDWVEVPEGANIYAIANDGISTFWGDEYQWTRCGKITRKASEDKSFSFSDWQKTWSAEILWQRHTQPEELPFVDDEPKSLSDVPFYLKPKSLNDTYAEIEQVRHNHYFKDVSDVNQIDVYEVLKRFNVTDPCLQHIVKKALCTGQRGHKDFKNDLQDILDTAKRAVEINK